MLECTESRCVCTVGCTDYISDWISGKRRVTLKVIVKLSVCYYSQCSFKVKTWGCLQAFVWQSVFLPVFRRRRLEMTPKPRWPSRRENRWFPFVRMPGSQRAKELLTTPPSTPWLLAWWRKVRARLLHRTHLPRGVDWLVLEKKQHTHTHTNFIWVKYFFTTYKSC